MKQILVLVSSEPIIPCRFPLHSHPTRINRINLTLRGFGSCLYLFLDPAYLVMMSSNEVFVEYAFSGTNSHIAESKPRLIDGPLARSSERRVRKEVNHSGTERERS